MSESAAAEAIPVIDEEEPQVKTKPRRDQRKKPKRQPSYAVIIHNDDEHTFLYVAELLMKIFSHPLEKATILTEQVHVAGKAIVWTGTLEVAELKRDQTKGYGPDLVLEGAQQLLRHPGGAQQPAALPTVLNLNRGPLSHFQSLPDRANKCREDPAWVKPQSKGLA